MARSPAARRKSLALAWHVVHRIAYRISRTLLVARLALLVALLAILALDAIITRANAQTSGYSSTGDDNAKHQKGIDLIYRTELSDIRQIRNACLSIDSFMASMPAQVIMMSYKLSGSDVCISALTKLGRSGGLGYIGFKDNSTSPSLSFDTGFVSGFKKMEDIPADRFDFLKLKALADKCYQNAEPRNDLCNAAGHMYGLFAAHGMIVSYNQNGYSVAATQ